MTKFCTNRNKQTILIESIPYSNWEIEMVRMNIPADNRSFRQYTYEQLNGMIDISTVEDTRILKISATSIKPEEAKTIANALAEKAVTEIPKLMGTSSPNIAERAITPKGKSSPSLKKNVMMGAFGGMVVVLAIFTFLFITDDTIKTEEDVEKYLGIIPLTVIPDGNVKYGAYSKYNYYKGKKYYTPK